MARKKNMYDLMRDDDRDTARLEREYEKRRWKDSDGMRHTVNPAEDKHVPKGSYYHNQYDPNLPKGENKQTTVYNPDDTLADVKANKNLIDSPRQD
jgi:hypothetical protein